MSGHGVIGREREVDSILGLLAGPARIVTITGRAGVGKTTLARAVLARTDEPVGPVVELAGIVDPDRVAAAVAEALTVPAGGAVDTVDALARHIATDPLLLLIDNFEHVTAAAGMLATLVARCPELRFLVTSQVPLRLGAEHVLRLDPLPFPAADATTDEILACPAVRLYERRAAMAGLDVDAAAAPTVGEVCRRLEGLPLAIEIAAARAGTLPPGELVVHLDTTPFTVLERSRPDAPDRHQSLHAAIAWTDALLAPEERAWLRMLALVVGSFDLDTAAGLMDTTAADAIAPVSALVDLRLIEPVPVGPGGRARYTVPLSIARYAQDAAREDGAYDRLRRAHLAYWTACARGIAATQSTGNEVAVVGRIAADHTNLVHALDEATAYDDLDAMAAVARALAPYWWTSGYRDTQHALMERTLDRLGAARVESPAHAEILAWSGYLGLMRLLPAERDLHVDRLRAGVAMARTVADSGARLRTLAATVIGVQFGLDPEESAAAIAEGLSLIDPAASPRWYARFLLWSGMLANLLGDDDAAIELGRTALDIARTERDGWAIVLATMLLRPMVGSHPDLEADVPPTLEALDTARALGLTTYESILGAIAMVETVQRRDVDIALRIAIDTLTLVRSLDAGSITVIVVMSVISVLILVDDPRSAAVLHGALRPSLDGIRASLLTEQLAAYDRAVTDLEHRLGPADFDALTRRGANVRREDALELALAALRRHAVARSGAAASAADPAPDLLTPRQRELLVLVASGLTNKEIAARLAMAPKTVMHHLGAIYRALGVRGRTEAAMWAAEHGLTGA